MRQRVGRRRGSHEDSHCRASLHRDSSSHGDGHGDLDVWLQGTSRVELTGSDPVEHDSGPSRVRRDTDVVTEVVEIEDCEANVHWTIGLEDRQPLRVQTFDDPSRLVIDISD